MKIVAAVESDCASMSFEQATKDMLHLRAKLSNHASDIIQARIEFDCLCHMNLTTLTPLQLVRVSTLKALLIQRLIASDMW